MTLITWDTTTASIKVKEYEIVTKGSESKLKSNGSNFIVWLEEQTNHCQTMGLDSILQIAVGSCANIPAATTLFASYGLVTLDEITAISNGIYAGSSAAELISIMKDKWLYTRLFNSCEIDLQTDLSVQTELHRRRGIVTFKFLVDKVTEADSEAIRATELELSSLSLKEYNYDVSKLCTKLGSIVNTLKANGAYKNEHNNEIISALTDPTCCEEYRMHLLFFQRDIDNKVNVNSTVMIANIDNKYKNLKKSKKWISPVESKIDSKYMSMTAQQQDRSSDDKFKDTLREMILSADSETLTKMVMNFSSNSNGNSYKGNGRRSKPRKPEPWMLVKKLPNEPSTKVVNGKTAVYCDFCERWSLNYRHTTARCYKRIAAENDQNSNQANASNPNQANVTLQANLAALLRGHDESNLFNPTITMAVHDDTHFYDDDSLISYMPDSGHSNSNDNFSMDEIPFKHFDSFAHDVQDSSVESENENYSEEDLFAKVNIKEKFSKSSLDETMKSKKTFSPRVSFSVSLFSLVLSWAILLRNKLATFKTYLLHINQAHLDESFGIGLYNMEQ